MDDAALIEALVAMFFDAFTSGPDVGERLDGLRELFLPQAVIVRSGDDGLTVYDVDGFIAPRLALLTSGALQGFREWEVSARTDVVGGIAQRRSDYAKTWTQGGATLTGDGVKTLQLVRTAAGWRISALAWQDEALPG